MDLPDTASAAPVSMTLMAGGALKAAKTTPLMTMEEGVQAMVALGERFEPRPAVQRVYTERFEKYRRLWPLMRDYLKST